MPNTHNLLHHWRCGVGKARSPGAVWEWPHTLPHKERAHAGTHTHTSTLCRGGCGQHGGEAGLPGRLPTALQASPVPAVVVTPVTSRLAALLTLFLTQPCVRPWILGRQICVT
jgi:hypothetical protein